MSQGSSLVVVKHPLVDYHITSLRNCDSSSEQFRNQIDRLATFLAIEATKDLQTSVQTVQTPITHTDGYFLCQSLALIPILRAGLGLVNPVLGMLPEAQVWHLGMYRDEETAMPIEYYSKLPEGKATDIAMVLDPMLATGGSIKMAIAALKKWGVPDIRVLSVLAAPEGIEAIHAEFPDAKVFVCSVEEKLDARKFIVPGLGDAGDRMFNTIKD